MSPCRPPHSNPSATRPGSWFSSSSNRSWTATAWSRPACRKALMSRWSDSPSSSIPSSRESDQRRRRLHRGCAQSGAAAPAAASCADQVRGAEGGGADQLRDAVLPLSRASDLLRGFQEPHRAVPRGQRGQAPGDERVYDRQGNLSLSARQPLPVVLIRRLVKTRVKENEEKAAAKAAPARRSSS